MPNLHEGIKECHQKKLLTLNNSKLSLFISCATLMKLLETVKVDKDKDLEHMRFPVQYVNRPNGGSAVRSHLDKFKLEMV